MHANILTKVWDLVMGDWDTHMGQHRVAHVSRQLCKVDGADAGSQVDLHSCTDGYTHCSQGVEPEDYQEYSEINTDSVTT